jgi:hypothetical protein
MRSRYAWMLFIVLPFAVRAYAADLPTKFQGYVTSVGPSAEFDVGARRVTVDPKVTRTFEMKQGIEANVPADSTIRVGLRVRVTGSFDKRTGNFIANFVALLPPPETSEIKGTGLIEETPRLSRNARAGTLWVDGYPLQVTPQTKLLSADGSAFPLDQIATNVWASFQAKRGSDHSMEAQSITFHPNTATDEEIRYLDGLEPEIEQPDYASHRPGKIKFRYKWTPNYPWTLSILPDKEVQDYVSRVGESLVPLYQRELPASDPTKVNFRFYVVEKPSKLKETLSDACSTPGGVIYIPDNVLAVLDNEAQLAALLSNSIATVLEKHAYIHRDRAKAQNGIAWASAFTGLYGLPANVGNSAASSRFNLQMNEQASRIGLRYLLREGYDLREDPFAWTVAANENADNPLPIRGDPVAVVHGVMDVGLSALAHSVMDDVYLDYASTDYSHLKINRDAYQQMLRELRAAAPKLPKSKNYPER